MNKAALTPILISAWFAASCGGGGHEGQQETLPTVSVQAAQAVTAEWQSYYEAVGTVRARTSATMSAKVMGYVREVRVDAGDRVSAGDTLVVIDSRDLEAAYQQAAAGREEALSAQAEVENAIGGAKAQLELAQATFRRMNDLHEKKSISDQEFDEVSAKVKMAQANYEMALSRQKQLGGKIQQAEQAVKGADVMRGYAVITAPFNGTVTEKMVDPGNLSAPGAPLLTIEQDGVYRLEARVEESWLPQLKVGQEVEVALDALSSTVTARISEIVPAVDASSRTFTVRIDLPRTANLRSGLFGRARFGAGAKEVVAVPASALVTRGQVRSVYVIEDGQARSRLVTIGERHDDTLEVLSGLASGERVVAPAPPALLDGSPVEVRP